MQPRFCGISTFCRYPQICHVDPENEPVDWAIYGVPFDGAVTYRPGTRFGPRAIRDASQYVKPYHLEHAVMVTELLSLADAGDAPVAPYSCEKNTELACEYALKLGDPAHTKLFAVGGDHSIALANIRATHKRFGAPAGGMAMIHFDAHIDTVDEIWGEKFNHGSVFRRAIEEGLIDPKRMLTIGLRGPINKADDFQYALDHGVTIVTCDQLRREGTKRIDDFLKRLGDDPAYMTFDIDSFDPTFAPGTGTPCPGGLTIQEGFALLRSMAGVHLVGADLVEVLPDLDHAGVTALLASHVMFEILALDAVRVSKGVN